MHMFPHFVCLYMTKEWSARHFFPRVDLWVWRSFQMTLGAGDWTSSSRMVPKREICSGLLHVFGVSEVFGVDLLGCRVTVLRSRCKWNLESLEPGKSGARLTCVVQPLIKSLKILHSLPGGIVSRQTWLEHVHWQPWLQMHIFSPFIPITRRTTLCNMQWDKRTFNIALAH